MDPKVSVIMSVYNGERFLHEAVGSILNQTFSDLEFIIINDGSTDSTRMILESYTDPRMRIFNQKNIGLTRSLNKGLKKAKGKYIARQDADDVSDRKRLEYQVDFMENHPDVGLVGTFGTIINEDGRFLKSWKLPEGHDRINEMLLSGNCFLHGSVLFRRECLVTVGHYREEFEYAQDYDYWLRIAEKYKVENIDKELYRYRLNTDAISREKITEQLNYHLLIIQLARERRKTGNDSLGEIDIKNIRMELTDRFQMTTSQINEFLAKAYLNNAFWLLFTKDYIKALNFLLKSFFCDKKQVIKYLFKASRQLPGVTFSRLSD